jgi:hypothetical protein
MNNWTEYVVGHKPSKATSKLSKIIIAELGKAISDFYLFDTKIRPQRTRFIKDKLALLGHTKFNYKVYANGLSPNLTQLNGGTFKNSEWLFDLHWYVEGKQPYTTISLPLVMECEWQQKRRGDRKVAFSGIKYDFQKLLIANAEFRLMIFNVVKPTDFDQLSEYFEDNINTYKHLPSGAKFLFISFYEKSKTFFYREILKQ